MFREKHIEICRMIIYNPRLFHIIQHDCVVTVEPIHIHIYKNDRVGLLPFSLEYTLCDC